MAADGRGIKKAEAHRNGMRAPVSVPAHCEPKSF